MKPPTPEGAPRIDVSSEELEALLERARAAAGGRGLSEAESRDPHAGLCDRVAGEAGSDAGGACASCCVTRAPRRPSKVLKQAGIDTGEKKDKAAGRSADAEEYGRRAWAQWCGRVSRGAQGRSAARVVEGGRSVSGCSMRRQSLSAARPGRAGADHGQAPLAATVYELEKLRCNLCGEVFTAAAPEGVGEKKYDETAASMIALLRYGSGVPVVPAGRPGGEPGHPAAGVDAVGDRGGNRGHRSSPRCEELIRQAAQGEVVHNDDTSMRVLSLDRDADIAPGADRRVHQRDRLDRPGAADRAVFHRPQARRREPGRGAEAAADRPAAAHPDVRCAVAQCAEAAESLEITAGELSCARTAALCGGDAEFSRAVPVRAGNAGRGLRLRCSRRGRRACRPKQRLRFHQEHSGPVMEELHAWLWRAVRGTESRAELRPGRGDLLPAQALGEADAVPAPSRAPRWTTTSWSGP